MIYSVALSLLLGFELAYYLLILQTGIVVHYNSNIFVLFPIFAGGVLGTLLSGRTWGRIDNPIHKIMIALTIQLMLSFSYPDFNFFTFALLGIAVGMMAPLGIYLFKAKQRTELLFALAIAYSVGTYLFTSEVDSRAWMAVAFTTIALLSSVVLKNYIVETDSKLRSHSFLLYAPLVLWIFLDSNLFETLSRHVDLDIWSNYTVIIATFHIVGLVAPNYIDIPKKKQHVVIAFLFSVTYLLFYLELPFLLAIIYPFTISYYNVIVFRTLSREVSLSKLAFIMVFVGWIASGSGLMLALSKILY